MRRGIALVSMLLIGACSPLPGASTEHPSTQIAQLNHFYATVDAETAAAIRDSAFLRRFANLEVRTTIGTQSTWTGTYLYGRQTYVEVFGPSDFQSNGRPTAVGEWGIAISGDGAGHIAELQTRLEAVGHKAVVELETRTFGERKVPWFTALTAVSQHGDSGGRNEVASVWAMEYVPSYFELLETSKEAAEGPNDTNSRERYQSDLYQQRMMRDVSRVEFNVAAKDYARIEPLLVAAGFRMNRSGDSVVADGDETDFVFHLAHGQLGLRKVEFSLNAPEASHDEIIGKSRLSVGPGATAVWAFD